MFLTATYKNPKTGAQSELIIEGLGPHMILGAVADHLEGNVKPTESGMELVSIEITSEAP